MINTEKLAAVTAAYKEYFSTHWPDEKFKWEAIKHFQEHWDIHAADFAAMFETATERTCSLLSSSYFYPRAMIENFAKADVEATRAMFINLYDQSKDLAERIDQFLVDADHMKENYDDGTWKNHYQNTNAISTYLWLRFPDQYYIYKYSECLVVARNLESSFIPKRTSSSAMLIGGFALYDEICENLQQDKELKIMLAQVLTDTCYPDDALRTMTIDLGFFVSRFYNKNTDEDVSEWFPADYSPKLTVDDWLNLLKDDEVFTSCSLEIVKRMKDYGGMATCTQMSIKYGETKNFYINGSVALARRVVKKTGCPIMTRETGSTRWWPVLYVGKNTDKDTPGSYIWKLREELSTALEQIDLSEIALYDNAAPAIWKISHGTDYISDSEVQIFEEKQVIVVHKDTKSKAKSNVSQGESFMLSMKKGDYFYLCRSNSIRLFGQITSDEVTLNQEKQGGWCQRPYQVIARSNDTAPYKGEQKWWTPDANSTCIKVSDPDKPLFEKLIMKPYFDLTLEELDGGSAGAQGYWWLNANPKIWSYSNIGVGEIQSYTLLNANGNKRRIFKNFLEAKAGDQIIGYESYPVKQVVALAKVAQEQDGENLYIEKLEGLTAPLDYQTLKSCPELARMEYFTNPQGSLFKLTKGEYDFIMDLIRDDNPLAQPQETIEPYTKEQFLSEVYLSAERFDTLLALLKNKKNLILQGAPGVGKTFAAKRLAYAMMGEKDESRIECIQFHQNYSYEDFIMGYRPDGEGFKLTNGIFYQFCKNAENHPHKDYFFIIDEINRGNMSKIFGELLMLLERDYRETKITLTYSGIPFSVPKNLYLIGMMNTADRSLAMIDYALRRRFSFFELEPGFDSEGFKAYQEGFANQTFDSLIERIKELNRVIAADSSLGKGFRIGHSYFCERKECTEEWMKEVVYYDIIPMLSEYWFDDTEKLQQWETILSGVFHD